MPELQAKPDESGYQWLTQVRLGKVRIGKDRIYLIDAGR